MFLHSFTHSFIARICTAPVEGVYATDGHYKGHCKDVYEKQA